MTKKEMIEGGLMILGVGFVAWGAIYLVMNIVGWLYCVAVGNRETVAMYYAPDLIRTILANILQCAVGGWLVMKNRQMAAFMEKIGSKG